MNRRDLVKGLLALPFTPNVQRRASSQCKARSGCNRTKFGELRIALEGPFAVVCQTDAFGNIANVTAFAPLEDNDLHLFYFNGKPQDHANKKKYHFCLNGDQKGLGSYLNFSYKDDFGKFDQITAWKDFDDYFIRIDLPCPDRLVFVGDPATVTFQNDPATPQSMPVNHVFLYGVDADNAGITKGCDELNNQCPQDDSGTFVFEVGLDPNQTKIDPDAHARDFFNGKILPHFPSVQQKLTLASVHLAPKVKRPKLTKEFRSAWPFTTAVECKNGGLVVTT